MVFISERGAHEWAKQSMRRMQAKGYRLRVKRIPEPDKSVSFGYIVRFYW